MSAILLLACQAHAPCMAHLLACQAHAPCMALSMSRPFVCSIPTCCASPHYHCPSPNPSPRPNANSLTLVLTPTLAPALALAGHIRIPSLASARAYVCPLPACLSMAPVPLSLCLPMTLPVWQFSVDGVSIHLLHLCGCRASFSVLLSADVL